MPRPSSSWEMTGGWETFNYPPLGERGLGLGAVGGAGSPSQDDGRLRPLPLKRSPH